MEGFSTKLKIMTVGFTKEENTKEGKLDRGLQFKMD